jgi:hypothetical protein
MPERQTALHEVESRALQLSDQDRAELIDILVRSLAPAQGLALSPEWVKEVERRDREMDLSGEDGEPAAAVLAEMKALLG